MVTSKIVHISTLKGDKGAKGDKGDAGTFASISAESIGPGEQPEAIISGPPSARHLHLRLPRGLPGASDVPTDEAMADILAALDSVSRAVVDELIIEVSAPLSSDVWSFTQFPTATMETVSINNRTYSDPIVVLPNGDIVTAWFTQERQPVVGRFTPATNSWQVSYIGLLGGNPMGAPAPNDGHNSISVARDGDGYLHVAGNMHSDGLRYVRSSLPDDISAWKTINTGAQPLWNPVTYPTFLNAPNGDIIFLYRNGFSGGGDWYLQRWVVGSKTFTAPALIFEGRYLVPQWSMYPNSIVMEDSTIHVFFMWRPDGTETASDNDHFSYLRSEDEGVTWEDVTGTAATLPIGPETATGKFITGNHRYMNQCGATLDDTGNPHAIVRHQAVGGTYSLRHIWWDGAAWQNEEITTGPNGTLGRPGIVNAAGTLYALFRRGARARALALEPGAVEFDLYPYDIGGTDAGWEPGFDTATVATDGVLRIIVSSTADGASNVPKPVGPGGFGGIVTVTLPDAVAALSSGRALAGSAGVPTVKATPAPLSQIPSENVIALANATTTPWYSTGGERWSDSGIVIPPSRFHGTRVRFARTGAVSQIAVKVTVAAAAGSVEGVIAKFDGTVLARTDRVAVSSTGNKTLTFQSGGGPVPVEVLAGTDYLLGVVVWGGTGPQLMLTRIIDPEVGGSAVASVMDLNLVGYRNTGDQAEGGATLGTLGPSPYAPIVGVRSARNT